MSKASCIPHDLPLRGLDWERLAPKISRATLELARYDGTLNGIVNPAVLLSPLTSREAILSSQIEGTITTLVEMLQLEAGKEYDETKKGDIKEVINYRVALLTGENYLADRPVTLQLIRELHAMLLRDVRGSDKTPGKFRDDQNWLGRKGSPIEEARFIPPDPLLTRDHLDCLEAFIQSDYSDPLVQLAIVHAQFEIIHPFKDGNGRLGRMLVPLFLFQKRVLERPMFYLSEYLEEVDQEYRDRLLAITDNDDWQGWIEFFLTVICIQAQKNNLKAKAIHNLYEELKPLFRKSTRSQFSHAALDAFFNRPIINTADFITVSGINHRGTANSLLKALVKDGRILLLKTGAGSNPAIYAFPELINIVEGKKAL